MAEDLMGSRPLIFLPLPLDFLEEGETGDQVLAGRGSVGQKDAYLVRAMTLFFLGCWLTGLPMLPFFRDPFRASSRCFSAGENGKEAVSCPRSTRPCCLAGGLLRAFLVHISFSTWQRAHGPPGT